jgi:hypothetical protein
MATVTYDTQLALSEMGHQSASLSCSASCEIAGFESV